MSCLLRKSRLVLLDIFCDTKYTPVCLFYQPIYRTLCFLPLNMTQEYAYLTGGASGIGLEVARMLVKNKY